MHLDVSVIGRRGTSTPLGWTHAEAGSNCAESTEIQTLPHSKSAATVGHTGGVLNMSKLDESRAER